MIRIRALRTHRLLVAGLVVAGVVALAGCGSDEAGPSTSAPDQSPAEEESSPEESQTPTLESELADIEAAALTGLTTDQCDDILDLISVRSPGWIEETGSLDVDIDIISRSPDDLAERFERWLENAQEDAAAREQVQVDDSDSFAEAQDLAFNNPLGLNSSERAERRHEDAWIRLWLIRSCEEQIEEGGTGAGIYALDTEWPALPSTTPEDASEGASFDPAVLDWAADVVEVVGSSGLSAAYQEFGSEECRAAFADPLVAHFQDVVRRQPTAVETDEGSTWTPTIGAWIYGADDPAAGRIVIRRIVTSPQDEGEDVSRELTSAVPIVRSDGEFRLDDGACFSTA